MIPVYARVIGAVSIEGIVFEASAIITLAREFVNSGVTPIFNELVSVKPVGLVIDPQNGDVAFVGQAD